jgi:cytochrome c peroxidase
MPTDRETIRQLLDTAERCANEYAAAFNAGAVELMNDAYEKAADALSRFERERWLDAAHPKQKCQH